MAMAAALAAGLITCFFFSVIPHATSAPIPGFLHIACGAPVPFTDSVGVDWVTDDAYISTGEVGRTADTTVWPGWLELANNRYFPDSRAKNCFTLPVTPHQTYLLRAEFMFGDYSTSMSPPFSFQIAQDATIVENVTIPSPYSNIVRELIFSANRTKTSLCLVRHQDDSTTTPFINSISLRTVANLPPAVSGWLAQNQFVSVMTRLFFNQIGAVILFYVAGDPKNSDAYDRFWYSTNGTQTNGYPLSKAGQVTSTAPLQFLSSGSSVNLSSAPADLVNQIPPAVLQGAMTTAGNLTIPLNATTPFTAYIQYYFVELDLAVNATDRSFFIDSPGVTPYDNDVVNATGGALRLWVVQHDKASVSPGSEIVLYPDPARTSSKGPMISGLEVFKVDIPWVLPTNSRDYAAIESVKTNMRLTSWGGDPCLPYPHEWVTCNVFGGTTEAVVNEILLSGYNLSGVISPAFNQLLSITTLKLDNNSLTGPIPDLSALKSLKTLDLQNNNLTGPLPDWLTSLPLQELLVQNNDLSGNIPSAFLTKNWKFNYSGNPSLTPGPPATKSNIGPIIGGVVGGLVALAVIIGLIVFFCCRRRGGNKNVEDSTIQSLRHHGLHGNAAKPGGAREYSLAEVDAATGHYKQMIGRGGFGPVYYGKLPDGTEVAVKVLDKKSTQGHSEFSNEVDILSRVHHRHLVSLLGYCRAQEQRMLIYEYIHKGSLRDHLHGTSKTGAEIMDWKTRLNIGLQAAQGLDYLHTGCQPSFIHRDVKSNNILITSRNEAKVADLGLSRLVGEEDPTQMMTTVKGTIGYLDPEYYNTQYLSAKSDVYSFGVVLLELITGRLPVDLRDPNETNPNLCEWARLRLLQGDIDAILDPELRASRPNHDSLWKVAEIALRSVEPKSVHRPTMAEVVQELLGAVQLERGSGPHHNMSPPRHSNYAFTPQFPSDIPFPR